MNSTRAKRCLRVRGTQDLETVQQALSAVGSSCRWSMTVSSISGGREGSIVVCSGAVGRRLTIPVITATKPDLTRPPSHRPWTKD